MGRLAAQRWAEAGGTALAVDVNEAGLKETAEGRPGIQTRVLDVTDADAVGGLVEEIWQGVGPFDRVYNAAAIQPTNLLLEQDLAEIHRVMAINYGGLVNVSKAVLPRLLERGRGSLIHFASIAGWVPNMHFGAYNASKFAAVAFTEVLYHENRGNGVHIACVCPPPVDTPLMAQAVSNPKILNTGPAPMKPAKVLDVIDRACEKGKFWVFPGAHTVAGLWLRRLLPGVLWKIDHNVEGF